MRQGSTRRGKPHCEAFPAIDILEAERSRRMGGTRCEWRDEGSQIVGHGQLVTLDASRGIFNYDFVGSPNIERTCGTLTVDTTGNRRNPNVVRNNFICPKCGSRRQKLFFVTGWWACKQCHGLVHLTQRLGNVNKLVNSRDIMATELAALPPDQRSTRWYYNRQRHIERLNRELAVDGIASLPQELLYRTHGEWLEPGKAWPASGPRFSDDRTSAQPGGLAYLQPAPLAAALVEPCESIGSLVLDRPTPSFLSQHKARHFAALERDIVGGMIEMPSLTSDHLAELLAERIKLRPLALTSSWSGMASFTNSDGQQEHAVTASYEGDPTLWRIGPGASRPAHPLRAILADETVTLQVRSPARGRAEPRRDLDAAIEKFEARLAQVRAEFERFNASRHEAAARRVRYDLQHRRRPDGGRAMLQLRFR